MAFSFKDVMLSHDLGYISDEVYDDLTFHIEGASYNLNAYCRAINEDRGIHDWIY